MTSAFERLLADLSEAEVDYILVGGLAVAFCGHVRATEDVDILVQVDDENLARLLEVLAGFGEGSAAELQIDDFTLEEGAIRVIEAFPLDIFTQMSGYRYEDLESMTTTRRVNDHTIRHLNIEGLITLKEESLRQKDQMDVGWHFNSVSWNLRAVPPREDSRLRTADGRFSAFIGGQPSAVRGRRPSR